MKNLVQRLAAWLTGRGAPAATPPQAEPPATYGDELAAASGKLVPYDENLLERSRTQWQFGDWQTLAELSREQLQHHPDRAKLALLAAAGHQALGNVSDTRRFVRLAMDWGCSKRLVSQILIAGVHNTLGRVAAIGGDEQRAVRHFQAAISTGTPGNDVRLLAKARATEQLAQLALPAASHPDNPVLDSAAPPPQQPPLAQ